MEDQEDIFKRAKRQLSVPDALHHAGFRVRGDNFAKHWASGGRKGRLKPCPICGAKSEGFSFCQSGWRCHHGGGDVSGSVIDLIARLHHVSPLEAAKRIVGEDDSARQWKRDYLAGKIRAEKPEQPQPSVEAAPVNHPREILASCRASRGVQAQVVTRYLLARGVAFDVAQDAARALRASEFAPYRFNARGEVIESYPAMVAIVSVRDKTGGLHCTYLAADFNAKAAVDPAKKMWGPQGIQAGDITLPGGALLIPPKEGGWLCVAEGIETTLCLCSAVRRATGEHAGAFATLSLGRLQGGMARNKWGRPDYFKPAIDVERPPALILHVGGRVIIGVDHDMKDLKSPEKVNEETGEITGGKIIATGARRAQVCALLAAQWWARPIAQGGAGARLVRPAIAPKGKDWGDVMQGLAA